MKVQVIYNEQGVEIHRQAVGWVSENQLVSKVQHKMHEEIIEVNDDEAVEN